jgi:hypothetical protein
MSLMSNLEGLNASHWLHLPYSEIYPNTNHLLGSFYLGTVQMLPDPFLPFPSLLSASLFLSPYSERLREARPRRQQHRLHPSFLGDRPQSDSARLRRETSLFTTIQGTSRMESE